MAEKTDLRELEEYDEDDIFRPEKLALVHVTSYMPSLIDGQYEIQSTAEALDYLYPRNTIHFTIGHHVDAVFGGNWDDKGIMIVASLKDTIDSNDKPLGMSSFDTYFETTPDHNLRLPTGTHLFIPTTDSEKLGGKLQRTEGDITYYKSGNYTDDEKEEIFSAARFRGNRFGADSIFVGGGHADEEEFKKLPNGLITLELKKNLLNRYLKQTGYVTNSEHSNCAFNSEGSAYAEGVRLLGKKLGCRFCTSGNKGHYNSDFTDVPIVSDLFRFQRYADFILHPDDYEATSSRSYGSSKKYEFRRKDGKGLPFEVWNFQEGEEARYNKLLKDAPDFTDAMQDAKKEESSVWSPAFRETYDTWMKKTTERLNRFYAEAKEYSFDKAWEKIQEKMQEYDRTKGGLLTRAFARSAKTEDRGKKAEKLLKVLRERDSYGTSVSVAAYLKQKGTSK